ncbi:putative B3 domain-containing protein Os03g0621600 [Vigna umbellata]|uniref:putative B3 domain-containing protein Os03g0621600 n=1 Tax=Vigna umbellata TaxID=87088 RepID=UPI001F5EABB6|nr:putative B3 domain-containing protein Os03g0621600 [Vigna umbellata]
MTMRDFSFYQKALIVQGNGREMWQMDYYRGNPVFFVIINNSKLQKVPEGFLKHLNEDFQNAVLIGPSGDNWQVTILKKGNNIYLYNGWPQFLTDNSVMLDDFLLFTYHGGNCFHVQIFGKNGLERLCFKQTRQDQVLIPSLVRTKKNTHRRTSSSPFLHQAKSYKKGLSFSSKFSFSKLKSSVKIESSEACYLADSFTSRNPHWKHLMTKCNVEDHCTLPIATEFARKHIPETVKQIILWNTEGKFWEVVVTWFGCQNKRYTRFTTGWGRFVRDNRLMRGDTCIFELEDQNHLSVHIFRTGFCAPKLF